MAELEENGTLLIGDYVLNFSKDEPQEEHKKIAEKELRETPEVRQTAVATFRKMVRDIEDFNFPLDGDAEEEMLIRFLRPCKFYPESALKLMKSFFAFNFNNPKLCYDLLCKEDKNVFNQNMMMIVPSRDQHGRGIVLVEVGTKWIPSKCTLTEYIRGAIIMIQGAIISHVNQIHGVVMIMDAEGLSLTHLFQLSPSAAMTILHYVQDCLPLRVKAIHVVHQSQIFTMAFAIFKPFLSPKLRSRIHLHGRDRESILKHIDAKALPVRYGGDLECPEVPGEKFYDFFSTYKKSYKEIAALGYTKKPKC